MSGRFTNISKVDTPYIPVDLDLSKPKMLLNQQLNKELDLTLAAIQQDAATKLKYGELLSKIRPQDYSKAEQLLDKHINERANAIANSKDRLSLAAAQSSGASLLSNPAFSKLISDKAQIDSELEVGRKLREQGKYENQFNPQVLQESRYDENGNETSFNPSNFKVAESLDYDKDIQELMLKEAKPDIFPKFDPRTGMIINTKTLGTGKLENIANQVYPAWRNSGYGKSLIEELTQITSSNNGKVYPKEVAEQIAKQRFIDVAKGLAFSEQNIQDSAYSRNAAKAAEAPVQQFTPQFVENVPGEHEEFTNENSVLPNSKNAIAQAGKSSNNERTEIPNFRVNSNMVLFDKNGHWFNPKNEVVEKAVKEPPTVDYVVIDVLDKHDKPVNKYSDAFGKPAVLGDESNIGIYNKKEPVKKEVKDGKTIYSLLDSDGNKVILARQAFNNYTFIDKDGHGKKAKEAIVDPIESYQAFDENYSGRETIQLNDKNQIDARISPNQIETYKQFAYNDPVIMRNYHPDDIDRALNFIVASNGQQLTIKGNEYNGDRVKALQIAKDIINVVQKKVAKSNISKEIGKLTPKSINSSTYGGNE